MAVIRTYNELLSALEALPSPAAGRLRVYRGQNRDFGSMKPTALRGVRDREQVWRIFSHRLAHAFAPDLASQNVDLDLIMLWLRAIKQHYGPGTEFLDVTHSPGIGAWFALHAMRYETAQITYGPPGPFDPHRDVIGLHELVEHARYEAPAVLYVIDAVKGSGPGDLQHGTVFDLALAPKPFSTSPRIRAQQGCLVYADADVDGGDLSSLYAPGTPLEIGWPLSGCAEVLVAPDEIFPDIDQDEWYRRFVSIPLMPAVGKSEQATIYEHPIRVSLYEPQSATYALDHERLEALTELFVVQRPALVYAALRADGFDAPQVPALAGRFAAATALLMEGPMMSTIPPVERINLGVLLEDRTSAAPRWDVVTGAAVEDADLTNVFVELSTLDRDGWERAETNMDFETVRGIWLSSNPDLTFYLTTFIQTPSHLQTVGPMQVLYHPLQRELVLQSSTAPGGWVALREFGLLHRTMLKSLTLVRSLAPVWKLGPWAQLELGSASRGAVTSHARLEWALGRVVSFRGLAEPIRYYDGLRMWDRPEPYYGDVELGSPAVDGGIRTEGQPYAEIAAEELLPPETRQQLADKPRPPLPGVASVASAAS